MKGAESFTVEGSFEEISFAEIKDDYINIKYQNGEAVIDTSMEGEDFKNALRNLVLNILSQNFV